MLTESLEPGENDDAAPNAMGAVPASAHSTELASPGIDTVEEVTCEAEFEAFMVKYKLQTALDVVLDSSWFVLLCRGEAPGVGLGNGVPNWFPVLVFFS